MSAVPEAAEPIPTETPSDPLVLVMAEAGPAPTDGDEDAPFTLAADDGGAWVLRGEVDFASAAALESALAASASTPWVVDVAGLDFIDVAGMRAIARSAAGSPVPLELRRAPERVQRLWRLAGFDRAAPGVRLVG